HDHRKYGLEQSRAEFAQMFAQGHPTFWVTRGLLALAFTSQQSRHVSVGAVSGFALRLVVPDRLTSLGGVSRLLWDRRRRLRARRRAIVAVAGEPLRLLLEDLQRLAQA